MKLLKIATLIALLTVVDHSSSRVLATTTTTTKTSEYETLEQEDDAGVVVPLPSLLRAGAKKKEVYQFLSDGNGDGDSSSRCGMTYDLCDPNDPDNAGCCSGWHCGIGHTCLTAKMHQFLSDGDSEELSCSITGGWCMSNSDCCSGYSCDSFLKYCSKDRGALLQCDDHCVVRLIL